MTIGIGLAVTIGAQLACRDGRGDSQPDAWAPVPSQPTRGAAGDDDLRVMLAEIAARKACSLIRGRFLSLRDPNRATTVTGVLWLHGCTITQHGTDVVFRIAGSGWQWVEKKQEQAGASFAVQQYVRFAVRASVPGSLDIAYDQETHVASVWFTPKQRPEVEVTPIGDVEVDEQGTWSSIVGTIVSVFSSSPDEQAEEQAEEQGVEELRKRLAGGLSATLDLCTGLTRFGLGRQPKGKMVEADVGESHQVPIELRDTGVLIFGPQPAPRGLTVEVRPRTGALRVELVCHDQAQALAKAYANGAPLPELRPLAARTVRSPTTLRARAADCPIAIVARPVGDPPADDPVIFDWKRPPAEAARATGGPLIDCGKE